MKSLKIAITLLILGVLTVAIIFFLYPSGTNQLPKASETGSTQEGIQKIVNANNRFGLELYSELSKRDEGNIFYSPYSLFSALAMTYEGANGTTAEEIKSVLHFPDYDVLRPNFAAFYNEINKRHASFELKTANALWVQEDYPLRYEYLNTIKNYYGGKAENLDFMREPETSRQIINNYIKEETNNKIDELLPPHSVDATTRLVITNAIYFNGRWAEEFDKKNTKELYFKTPTDIKKVQMMYMKPKTQFNYTETDDLQILELPYKGNKISMLILLPKGNLDRIEPLTIERLSQYKKSMSEVKLDEIYIPKFELDTSYPMKEILRSLGMSTAFSPGADFSRMVDDGLFISQVFHDAYVKVDEEGTEAAAASAVVFTMAVSRPKKIFKADHPFIFIIQDKDTGAILFMGRITDPTK